MKHLSIVICFVFFGVNLSANTINFFPRSNSIAFTDSVNVKEWLNASKMLSMAAQLIRKNGWQQGSLTAVYAHCAATALEAAFRQGKFSIVDFNYAREALSRTIHVAREPQKLANDRLEVPYWGRSFMEWNDAPGRTKEEVLKAFNDASNLAISLSKKH